MTTRLFGERVPRREDGRFLTGRGRYTADFERDAAQAAFVRSDLAHGRVLGVDTSAASAVSGRAGRVHVGGSRRAVRRTPPAPGPERRAGRPRTQYALARDEVCYAGEVVAMVVARDRYVAEDAAELIEVDYEPLEPAVDLEARAAGGRPAAHLDMTDNLAGPARRRPATSTRPSRTRPTSSHGA